MDETQSVALLQEHGVKPTANRITIVRALASDHRPMSMTEMEAQLHTIDKSVIFRTLTKFKEQHLVHAIEDGSGEVRYELCNSHDEENDDDMHVHFYCEDCHQTFCLEGTPVPEVELPAGYEQSSVNYMVKGLCPRCARRKALKDIR